MVATRLARRLCTSQSYHAIVTRLTKAWHWKAPFRHNQAPSQLAHWNKETFHAVSLVYRLIGFSWMRCGDASTNYDYVCHPGTHDHLRGSSTERGLSDRDICGPTNDGVSLAVLGLVRDSLWQTWMRDCLILVTLLTLTGCASIGPAKETPPANQTNPMPPAAESKTLLHVP